MTQKDSLTGQLAGARYRFGERLAEDESFELYAATQSTISRPVLVRIAREPSLDHKDALTEEAQALSRFDRFGLARPVDVATFKRRAFIVLDVGGAEPVDRWADRCAEQPDEVCNLMKSWADSIRGCLRSMHAAGLRIENPESQTWLLGEDGRAWLASGMSIGREGPVAHTAEVIRTVLTPIAERSEDARAALGAALIEPRRSTPPPAPRTGPTERVRERMVDEWQRTSVRSRVAGGVGLSLAVTAALALSLEPGSPQPTSVDKDGVHYVLPTVEVAPVDPDLIRARHAVKAGDNYDALEAYRAVSKRSPDELEEQDLEALVAYLELANAGTRSAGQSLTHVGRRAEPVLRRTFRDRSVSTYHRRRAGEVLHSIGARADLVPLYIEALDSKRCAARRLAAVQLAKSKDPRALEPLEELADKDGWFRSYCGADEAEVAFDRLSDQLERS